MEKPHISEGVNDMKLFPNKTNRRRNHALAAACLAAPLIVFGLMAQTQTQTTPPPSADAPDLNVTKFGVITTNLVAPVLVTDHNHNIVDGLKPSQFHLYDNGVEQNIAVDSAYEPVSLVVAIEKSARVDGILPQLHKLGILLTQITGMQGETAVMAFDCRPPQPAQDFTTDNDKIRVAIQNIKSGCNGTRLDDAVERGIYMLSKRPTTNRRVLLLVSETRDEGSQSRLKEVMQSAVLSNVQVYAVDISQLGVRLNEKQDQPYPMANVDMANQNLPMGQASTPTSMEQNYGMANRVQFVPLLKEIFIDTKGIFVKDHSTQFVNATGGAQFVFLRQKGLEDAIQRISQDIHSQYLVSYKPSNPTEGGYHTILVTIDREPTYNCRTRPGYWIGGGTQ
jgi:VWFA-related protein